VQSVQSISSSSSDQSSPSGNSVDSSELSESSKLGESLDERKRSGSDSASKGAVKSDDVEDANSTTHTLWLHHYKEAVDQIPYRREQVVDTSFETDGSVVQYTHWPWTWKLLELRLDTTTRQPVMLRRWCWFRIQIGMEQVVSYDRRTAATLRAESYLHVKEHVYPHGRWRDGEGRLTHQYWCGNLLQHEAKLVARSPSALTLASPTSRSMHTSTSLPASTQAQRSGLPSATAETTAATTAATAATTSSSGSVSTVVASAVASS
jgi:hypothetical protein